MKRAVCFAAALVAGLSTQAFAAEQTPTTAKVAVEAASLTANADAQTIRQLLLSQGYSNISELNRDTSGRWVGTAVKDGKTVGVAMALPKKQADSKTN